MNRRDFLKKLGIGGAAVSVAAVGVGNPRYLLGDKDKLGEMTYRTNSSTGDKVALLGYGMMRLPTSGGRGGSIDQDQVNRLVDYAIEHGVNYFDTSPVYHGGKSEISTGIALHRYPRNKYFVATKLSNFDRRSWSFEDSKKMYLNSFKNLQVDCIDYYLLHGVGGTLADFNARFVDNGVLDFLLEERKAGRIRNLGFSFHGMKDSFDEAMKLHEKYHWDFVQIQMNYMDWKNAKSQNPRNVNAEYLYNELTKRNISVVIMEPLLGGRLAKVPGDVAKEMKQHEPEQSAASWAFRFCGSYPNVLTTLSGMTYMEHLEDNLKTFCPLKPLNDSEMAMLQKLTNEMLRFKLIPCTTCKYCMPCPAGVDIPLVFSQYNKTINDKLIPMSDRDADYEEKRKNFLADYDARVPKAAQADNCIDCEECLPKCPQGIQIPTRMAEITQMVEKLKS